MQDVARQHSLDGVWYGALQSRVWGRATHPAGMSQQRALQKDPCAGAVVTAQGRMPTRMVTWQCTQSHAFADCELYKSCTRADVAPRTPAAITTFISPIQPRQHTFLLVLDPACHVLGPCVANDLCRDTQRNIMQALRAGAAQACQRSRLGLVARSGPQRAHACPSAVGLAGRQPLPQACSHAASSRMLGSSRARCVTVRAIATLPNKRDNRIPVTVGSCGSSSHSTCSVICMAHVHAYTLIV